MRKKGLLLAMLGVAFGIFAGMIIKESTSKMLIGVLEDEVRASCDCSLEYDKLSLSFLTLKASAYNVRMLEKDRVALKFKKIVATFSIWDIFNKNIDLKNLTLSKGYADGVGEQSATYKLIDHITAPSPNENNPNRWRLKLQTLTVKDSEFLEQFTKSRVLGSGVNLKVKRTSEDLFNLYPEIEKLSVHYSSPSYDKEVILGKVKGDLTIRDVDVLFHTVTLTLNNAIFKATGLSETKKGNLLSGEAEIIADASSLGLTKYFNGTFKGYGDLKGTLGNPGIAGNLISSDISPVYNDYPITTFNSCSVAYSINSNKGAPTISASIEATTTGVNIQPFSSFILNDEEVAGSFNILLDTVAYDNTIINGVSLNVLLSGDIKTPLTSINIAAQSIYQNDYRIGSASAKLTPNGENYNLEIKGIEDNDGKLEGKGLLIFETEEPSIKNFKYNVKDLIVYPPNDTSPVSQILFSATGDLSGVLSLKEIKSDINFTAKYVAIDPSLDFKGSALLRDGFLNIKAKDTSEKLIINSKIDLLERELSVLNLKAVEFSLPHNNEKTCVSISADAKYDFSIDSSLKGNGLLTLGDMQLGCAPYQTLINTRNKLKIVNGDILIPRATITTVGSSLDLSGQISLEDGYTLRAKGSLPIQSFVFLIPSIDQLSGELEVVLSAVGPLGSPNIGGNAYIRDAEVRDLSTDISATHVEGLVQFSNQKAYIKNLGGEINGGTFSVTGEVPWLNPEKTEIRLKYKDLLLEPSTSLYTVLSGELFLSGTESKPLLTGEIVIDEAQFEQNIDVKTILQALGEFLFETQSRSLVNEENVDNDIDLKLKIRADRNLFVITNWLESELRADIDIEGTLSDPKISGQMNTLNGWFGFRDKRFTLSSGRVIFKPNSKTPTLDILGEANFANRAGESQVVLLEAKGPLTNPKVSLSSDRGLTQREILTLLTTPSTDIDNREIRRIGLGVKYDDLSLLKKDSPFYVENFLYDITSIDSISLEPAYNIITGTIEPSVIAQKKILDRFTLIGEGLFGGTITESKLKLQYELSPRTQLQGSLRSSSNEKTSSLGIDLAFDILSKNKQNVKIFARGNNSLVYQELIKALRISEQSIITKDEIENLTRLLRHHYVSLGFHNAEVKAECIEANSICNSLTFIINEGEYSDVDSIQVVDRAGNAIIQERKFDSVLLRVRATESFLQETRYSFVKRFRNDGFISAKIKASYIDIPNSNNKILRVTIDKGSPVTFIFEGNKKYTQEELLNSINLFERKQPFGNNSISLLVSRITELYQSEGYVKVRVTWNENEGDEDRTIYSIKIDEGDRVKVSKVTFAGNKTFTTKELIKLVIDRRTGSKENILHPKFIIIADMNNNAEIIRSVLEEEGFKEARVTPVVESVDNNSKVILKYQIFEGPRTAAEAIEIVGLPDFISPPEYPTGAISIPKAELYSESVSDLLHERGYINAISSLDFSSDGKKIKVIVTLGERTTIKSINVTGIQSIDIQTINKNLLFSVGSPWDLDVLNESKRKLLKLGLFSKIEILPSDGQLDSTSEDLKIEISERPLQNLNIGVGLNSEFGFHLFGEAVDKSLFKDGRTIALRGDTYFDTNGSGDVTRGSASLAYTTPEVLKTPFSWIEDLRYQKLTTITQEFDVDRASINTYFYRTFSEGLTLNFGHTLSNEDLRNVSKDAILSDLDSGKVKLSFLSSALTFDQRDDPLNPRSGYYLSLEGKYFDEALTSDANFYNFGARATFLQPLELISDRLTLALSSRYNSSWTFGDTTQVPITQRYYLGGRNSVRGFRENSLGPRGDQGSIIGGDILQSNTVEFQYLVANRTSLHLFFDSGNVFLRDREYNLTHQRVSTGLGLTYLSPIGPIGFDVGHPLDEKKGEPSLRFHFSIGTTF